MQRFSIPLAAALLLWSGPSFASEEVEAFVEANLLSIFYHELGHALIDIEAVPIFGQEEDAADVFSIFLIDALFEEEDAQSIAFDAAWGFLGEAMLREEMREEVAWWDVHGPDEQRFYNTVCVFYGAVPEQREELAEALELPEERAEYCPFEYDQANDAWGSVLDEIWREDARGTIRLAAEGGPEAVATRAVVEPEIEMLNREFELSEPLTVRVESCGEANASYDPETLSITMCSEFETHLRDMASRF